MTTLWTAFLEIFEVGLFTLTQFYGGSLGAAIISFSVLARLALMPLTVRIALRARVHARRLKAIRPELAAVRRRFEDTPERLATETLAVYRRHGLSPADPGAIRGTLLQAPIFLGLFHAVRSALSARGGEQAFLWVSSLARPDIGVAMLAFSLVGLGTVSGASEGQPQWALAIPALSTAMMAMMLSAGFGLYLAATGLVGTLQGLIVRRIEQSA